MDEGIILAAQAHGENHSVLTLFTKEHGAAKGLVYGGQGRTKGSILQAGNGAKVTWRARQEQALGHFDIELTEARAGLALLERKTLLGLSAVTDILYKTLPEGQAYPSLYTATTALLTHLEAQDIWPILLLKWEIGLLETLGFGLTLDRCVATGRLLEDGAELSFISPKSGGAVSFDAGLPYKDKLLPLPGFLLDLAEPTFEDVKLAFHTTGYFLTERLLAPVDKRLPDARERYINQLP
ncbi:MAG: DNA repair protein RecO [Pseudomonadota bacterium]